MNNKTTMYALFALILGYSLITYIPSAFTPPALLSQRGPEANDDILSTTPGEETLGKDAETAAKEYSNAASAQSIDNTQYAYLIIDVSIALFVYYLARKRFM